MVKTWGLLLQQQDTTTNSAHGDSNSINTNALGVPNTLSLITLLSVCQVLKNASVNCERTPSQNILGYPRVYPHTS